MDHRSDAQPEQRERSEEKLTEALMALSDKELRAILTREDALRDATLRVRIRVCACLAR